MTVGSGSVNASNIKFSDLQIAYNNVSSPLALTNPISLSEFKGCEYIVSSGGGSGSQQNYIQPGSYNWTCPAGVTSVSVVCCGGGGGGLYFGNNNSVYQYAMNGGGGGGLGWKNNISVTPAQIYNVVVGAGGNQGAYSQSSTAGGDSYFINTSTVKGGRGFPGRFNSTANGGSHTGDGGGNGGKSYNQTSYSGPAGGGGAGGYSGNGGDGRQNNYSPYAAPSGGGGAGGYQLVANKVSGGGGGVGYLGEGSSGTAASEGGSGGSDGGTSGATPNFSNNGGNYGGGGGGSSSLYWDMGGNGGSGFVRIIWGDNRSYPNTNTDDQSQTTNVTYTIPTTNLSLNILKTNSFKDMSPNMTITAIGSSGSTIDDGDTTNDTYLNLTLTSTEPTSDFFPSDIIVTNGSKSLFHVSASNVYTVRFTPNSLVDNTTYTIDINQGAYTNNKTTIGCKNNAAIQFNWTYSAARYEFGLWNSGAYAIYGTLNGKTPDPSGYSNFTSLLNANVGWQGYSMGSKFKFINAGSIVAVGAQNRYGGKISVFEDGNASAVQTVNCSGTYSITNTPINIKYTTLSSPIPVLAGSYYRIIFKNTSGGYGYFNGGTWQSNETQSHNISWQGGSFIVAPNSSPTPLITTNISPYGYGSTDVIYVPS